jgi:putative ABC transport system permease protein
MRVIKTIEIASHSLFKNKVRTILTAICVLIGVASVIAMVSIGDGAKAQIQERFVSLGANVLTINPGSRARGGVRTGAGGANTLTSLDAASILERCPSVKYASPVVSTRGQVVFAAKNWNTSIQGVDATYADIRNLELDAGSFFDESQVRLRSPVAVLGPEVAQNLFGEDDPLGQSIRVTRVIAKIIGVLHSKGQAGGYFNQDDLILMPYTTVAKNILGKADFSVNSISASAWSDIETTSAQKEIEDLLRERHQIAALSEDDFSVRNMADIAAGAEQSAETMGTFLASIAAVSLIVAGISILSIMLVAVAERTREIGIRMSIGAKPRDIRTQFFIEAMILCLMGGILGILFGIGVAGLVGNIMGLRTVISVQAVVLSFCCSLIVGVIFGFYPAFKASRLKPIEALRYE